MWTSECECQNALRNSWNTFVWFGKCHLINDCVGRAASMHRQIICWNCDMWPSLVVETLICECGRWPLAITKSNKQWLHSIVNISIYFAMAAEEPLGIIFIRPMTIGMTLIHSRSGKKCNEFLRLALCLSTLLFVSCRRVAFASTLPDDLAPHTILSITV